jgi:hypothetical protein
MAIISRVSNKHLLQERCAFANIANDILRLAKGILTKLPKAEQNLEEWQTAIGCLVGAAEGRDFLIHARISRLRAINRHVERVFDRSRKNQSWGKRTLERDE